MFNGRIVAYCAALGALAVAASATAQVKTPAPSPAQASPRQESPTQSQPVVPKLNCAIFRRLANGSWVQLHPLSAGGRTINLSGPIITEGTVVSGIDLVAALNQQCSPPMPTVSITATPPSISAGQSSSGGSALASASVTVTPPASGNCNMQLGGTPIFCEPFDVVNSVTPSRTGALDPNVWGVSRTMEVNFGQNIYKGI
jgi:hypothetical protein